MVPVTVQATRVRDHRTGQAMEHLQTGKMLIWGKRQGKYPAVSAIKAVINGLLVVSTA
jgi:hypothetical protein